MLPKLLDTGLWGNCHIQGIAVDEAKGFIYYSFTTKLVKARLQDGEIVGTADGLLGHMGCIDFDPETGYVFGSLEYKHDIIGKGVLEAIGKETGKEQMALPEEDAFYMAIFDVDRIDRMDMDAVRDGIMRAAWLAEVVSDYRERLESRLKNMISDGVDPQRLAQEGAIMADRCAIDEELARLESHLRQMENYLEAEGEIGKKMDFLIQEMNRETNTIGSKAQDGKIAQWVVDLKSEIEKLREQIQNVE